MTQPTTDLSIRKTHLVRGKTLIFGDATLEDAELILHLCTVVEKGRFSIATANNPDAHMA